MRHYKYDKIAQADKLFSQGKSIDETAAELMVASSTAHRYRKILVAKRLLQGEPPYPPSYPSDIIEGDLVLRVCATCDRKLLVEEFRVPGQTCNECLRGKRRAHLRSTATTVQNPSEKHCTVCGEMKVADRFPKTYGRLQAHCQNCKSAARRLRRERVGRLPSELAWDRDHRERKTICQAKRRARIAEASKKSPSQRSSEA